jgi:hypothetical protein
LEAVKGEKTLTELPEQFDLLDFSYVCHGLLREKGIRISMDGKGRWRDNVFVELVWKSIMYEDIYLHAYESVHDARTSISHYLECYNSTRPPGELHLEFHGTIDDTFWMRGEVRFLQEGSSHVL